MNTTASFRLSVPSLIRGVVVHSVIVFGLTIAFCRGVGAYTLRRATDALMGIAFCYLMVCLSIWIGRALRFYHQTEHFTGPLKVTKNDRSDLPPARRKWLLLVFENQLFIPWVGVGLAALVVAILFGSVLSAQYPPDTVLNFLVSKTLNPMLVPGGLYNP